MSAGRGGLDERRPSLVTYRVRDMARALAFWHETLGIPVKLRSDRHVELQSDTVLVSLVEDPTSAAGAGSPVLGWEVSDLAAASAELRSRGVEVEAVRDLGAAGGVRAGFRDPDGHPLELVCWS